MKAILIDGSNFTTRELDDGYEYTIECNLSPNCRRLVLTNKNNMYISEVQATPLEAMSYQLLFLSPTVGLTSAVYYNFEFERLIPVLHPLDRHRYSLEHGELL